MRYRALAGLVVLAGYALGCSSPEPDPPGADQPDLTMSPPMAEPVPATIDVDPPLADLPPPETPPTQTPSPGAATPGPTAPAGAATPPATTPTPPAQAGPPPTPAPQTPPAQTPPAQTPPASTATRTVWDGVYTAAQARRGQQIAEVECAACHTSDAWAPLLGFWQGQTLLEPFTKTMNEMPQQDPGGLPHGDYVAIMAYILQLGGAPAGSTELPHADEALGRIRITPRN